MTPPPFVPFAASHVAALAVVGLVAGGLAALVRANPGRSLPLRLLLAAGQLALVGVEITIGVREGWLGWKNLLPLELCDAAMVLAIVSLVVPRRASAELVYYWAGTGTLLAMLTPELPWGFPRWEFLVFFGLHGLVVASASVLVFGLGLRPRPGAPLRVLAITAAYAAFVGLVNLALRTNFMYLVRKPSVATPLDWMGPWPVYIATGALLALVLFELLSLPFLREWRSVRRHR